ncbi:hypothetical protein CFFPNG_02787 [Methylorubrum aminovorans]
MIGRKRHVLTDTMDLLLGVIGTRPTCKIETPPQPCCGRRGGPSHSSNES